MSEKDNILYLCVCMALSDHKLDNDETAEIIKISKKLNTKFHVQDAAVEINKKFKDDLDMAQDFYIGNIDEISNRKDAKEFVAKIPPAPVVSVLFPLNEKQYEEDMLFLNSNILGS